MNNKAQAVVIILAVLAGLTLLVFTIIGPVMIVYNNDAALTSNYVSSTCVVVSQSVMNHLDGSWCCNTQYIPMWQANDGYSIVQSPHDIYTSFQDAQDKLRDYPLNVTLHCMCDFSKSSDKYNYPNISYNLFCQIYTRCFLDVATVKDIQANIIVLNLGGIFTAVGYGALFLILAASCSVWLVLTCCGACKRNYTRV